MAKPRSFVLTGAKGATPCRARMSLTSARKQETREAILAAATELSAEGIVPGVPEAAQRAGVSRATAYRHFPSREFLIVEMALPVSELRAALASVGRDDPVRRIAAVVRTVAEWCFEHELVLREMLRVALSGDKRNYQRPNTRMELIARHLEPLRSQITAADYHRLSLALALLIGIEPLAVTQDIAGLSREEALDTLEWTAAQLVRASLITSSP